MSWSVQAVGKAAAVRAEISRQFSRTKCDEPEETVRQGAAAMIDMALGAQDPGGAVKVQASGSQGYKDWGARTGVSNQLTILIEPQYGFVEE